MYKEIVQAVDASVKKEKRKISASGCTLTY